jgi:hypothetical protein
MKAFLASIAAFCLLRFLFFSSSLKFSSLSFSTFFKTTFTSACLVSIVTLSSASLRSCSSLILMIYAFSASFTFFSSRSLMVSSTSWSIFSFSAPSLVEKSLLFSVYCSSLRLSSLTSWLVFLKSLSIFAFNCFNLTSALALHLFSKSSLTSSIFFFSDSSSCFCSSRNPVFVSKT